MHNIRFDRREKLCGPQKPTVQKSNDLNSIKHGKNVLYGKNEVAISTVLQSKVFPSDWLAPCNNLLLKEKVCPQTKLQTISPPPVLVDNPDAMGNTGSMAEVITHLETPLVGVKTKSCWTRNNNNDNISSQMFHQPPVVPLARLSSDTTRNRPAHRSARARNIILDRQDVAWDEVKRILSQYHQYNIIITGRSYPLLVLYPWRSLSSQGDSVPDSETKAETSKG